MHSVKTTIREQVYSILKENIFQGVYKPGQRLQEMELAAALNVSRSPIREALRRLASEGLVVEFPNRGVVVKRFTEEDIDQIFEVRVLLESYAIHHCAEHLTQEARAELEDCLAALIRFHQSGQLDEYIEQDTRLHQAIIRLSGNAVLADMYERVYSLIQRFRSYSLTSATRFSDSLQEHKAIVEAILEGDPDKADRINREHLTLARQTISTYLETLQTDSSEY